MTAASLPAVRGPGAVGMPAGAGLPRAASHASARSERDLRLDLFRGIALFAIFIDHIPDNFLSNVTVHSFAFCDAAELFVFISGFAAALAYGRLLQSDGWRIASAHVYHRIWQLYVAHIFIFAIFAAEVSSSIPVLHSWSYAEGFRIDEFLREPGTMIIQALTLQFQPQFLDILPLYMALLAAFPLVLAAIARHPLLALVPSGALYAATHLLGWTVPAYPAGHTWFFNPLAWQFLFVIGAVFGFAQLRGVALVPKSRRLTLSAVIVAGAVAAIALSWMIQSNFTDAADPLFKALAPYIANKGNLGPVRLASFLVLAFAISRLVRPGSALLATRAARGLIICGQHSLHVFCLGILLAVLGQFVLSLYDGAILVQLAVNLAGGGLMIGLGLLIAWDKAKTRPDRAPAPATAAATVN
ncbi:MAG TPA: OpgC domain-containing protein [Xanthobacteraceae bacterium]|nr:OpgC domain-containing protein [Xanthobacteraceae bacterium]